MKTLLLAAALLAAAAPAVASAFDRATTDASPTTEPAAAVAELVATPVRAASDESRLLFIVEHRGSDAPALVTLEGEAGTSVHAFVLQPGRRVIVDDEFPVGRYRITLQMPLATGTHSVELDACPGGTLVLMRTHVSATSVSMEAGNDECLPADA